VKLPGTTKHFLVLIPSVCSPGGIQFLVGRCILEFVFGQIMRISEEGAMSGERPGEGEDDKSADVVTPTLKATAPVEEADTSMVYCR